MQELFKKLLSDIFNELFKPLKWKKQGSNYRYISDNGLGKIINFQKSKWNTQDEVTFYINYGLYIEVGNSINKTFKEYDCQFRNRTSYLNGIYTLTPETDIEEFRKIIITALREATAFLNTINSKDEFIKSLLNGEIQKHTYDIVMHYYTCKLLYDLGFYREIYDYVRGKGGEYFESLTELIEQKMKTEV